MSFSAEQSKAAYSSVRASLPPKVRLVAVSKGHSADEIEPVIAAGCREIGESRIQEAEGKILTLRRTHPGIIFHMVGHLQRNKAKDAVALFDVIQSVDSVALAQKIAIESQEQKRSITIFLQFRISGQESQSGYTSEAELAQAVSEIRRLESIHAPYFHLGGLMGIASRDHPRGDFKRLRQLAASFSLPILSMGMSGDYKIAVEEGSTMLRLGRALFGEKKE